MKLEFRTEQPGSDQYFQLYESTGWNEKNRLTKEELSSVISKSYFMVSAYHENRLIGFGRIVSDGIIHAMIYEMIVDPLYQNKGIGAEIINLLIQKCKDDGIRDIQLFCAKGKRGFYEKYGFEARPEDAPGMQYKEKP